MGDQGIAPRLTRDAMGPSHGEPISHYGRYRTRTYNPLNVNQVLYQLS